MKNQFALLAAGMLLTFACQNDSPQPGVETDSQSAAGARVAAPTLHPSLKVGINCTLRSNDKTIVITKNVSFPKNDDDVTGYHWKLPTSIDTVIIKKDVKLIGGFKIVSNDKIVIKGESPKTSIIYGTITKDWSQGRLPDGDKPSYSAITEDKGASGITAVVENLKLENSRIYAITFRGTNKLFAKRVYILNTRGSDYQSNSDGIVAGSGSVIDDCYIDTWDDSIKFYYDNITVKNTTIVHNQNGAPFQLGWDTKSALTGTIDNVKVLQTIDNSNANQALFCYGGASGTCNATIKVNRLQAEPYGTGALLNMVGDNPRTPQNEGVKKAMPIVGFKSFTNGCSLRLVGDNNQDITVTANAGYQSQNNTTASVKADKICSNSTNVNLGKTFSCATASGCSWN